MSTTRTVIAGFDFGTSSAKLVVTTAEGEVLFRATDSYPTEVGAHGEVEQSPEDWWSAAKSLLSNCPVAAEISAIGVTGQMQDLILVDSLTAVRTALLYSDTRAAAQHARLCNSVTGWESTTANHQDVSNVAAKFAWLVENDAATVSRASHMLFGASGYIVWRAGALPACDLTTASTTGLLDIPRRDWFGSAIDAAGIDRTLLPALVGVEPGDSVVGTVSADAAADLGVTAGIPLVLAPGDAVSTTDGLIGSSPNDAYLYLGTTGWFAAVTSRAPADASPIHTLAMPGWQSWLRIGAVQSAGSAAEWARKTYFPDLDFESLETLIAPRVEELHARPLCLPGISGERTPVRDGDFRGAFIGVHESTDRIDFYLAVLTGIAMGLRHAADDMGIEQRRIPLVGGAAASKAWRRILADVFDATIVTRSTNDPGSWSAARSAANALNIHNALHPLLAPNEADVETRPSANRARYDALLAAHRPLYEALAPTFHQLSTSSQ